MFSHNKINLLVVVVVVVAVVAGQLTKLSGTTTATCSNLGTESSVVMLCQVQPWLMQLSL